MALLLNKTGNLNQNGDSLVMVYLQNDTTQDFTKWVYPNLSKVNVLSFSN